METEVGHWYSVFCPSARLRQLVCWRRPKWFSYSDFWRISSFRSGKNGANSGQVVLLQGRMLFGAFASAPFGLSVGPLGTRIEPPEICSRATCLLCPFPGFQIATFGGREGRVLFAVIVELQGVGKAYHIEQHHRVKQRNAHTIFLLLTIVQSLRVVAIGFLLIRHAWALSFCAYRSRRFFRDSHFLFSSGLFCTASFFVF